MPSSGEHPYDLEERTSLFGEAIITFARKIPIDAVTERLIKQLVGASTSVGANYCEADDAVSKRNSNRKSATVKRRLGRQSFSCG